MISNILKVRFQISGFSFFLFFLHLHGGGERCGGKLQEENRTLETVSSKHSSLHVPLIRD